MATKKRQSPKTRNIGLEILQGLRDIKAGKVGRVYLRPGVEAAEESGRVIAAEARRRSSPQLQVS